MAFTNRRADDIQVELAAELAANGRTQLWAALLGEKCTAMARDAAAEKLDKINAHTVRGVWR